MPYFYPKNPDNIILNGELEFNKQDHPRDIYKKLCHTAEDVGGLVSASRSGIGHGAVITVIPAYDPEYYELHIFLDDPNDIKSTLRVAHVVTWRKVALLDLKDPQN